jgi:hypothetical protein
MGALQDAGRSTDVTGTARDARHEQTSADSAVASGLDISQMRERYREEFSV